MKISSKLRKGSLADFNPFKRLYIPPNILPYLVQTVPMIGLILMLLVILTIAVNLWIHTPLKIFDLNDWNYTSGRIPF